MRQHTTRVLSMLVGLIAIAGLLLGGAAQASTRYSGGVEGRRLALERALTRPAEQLRGSAAAVVRTTQRIHPNKTKSKEIGFQPKHGAGGAPASVHRARL